MNTTKDVQLSIDTTHTERAVIALTVGGVRDERVAEATARRSQSTLPIIEALLSAHGLSVNDVTAISVHTGPGSFTGVRVGIAIAQALGFILGVPVNGLPPGSRIDPIYAPSKWETLP